MKELLQQLKRIAYRALCKKFGFTIHCEEFNGMHYALKWSDAVEWMSCYPWATICVRGVMIASKG